MANILWGHFRPLKDAGTQDSMPSTGPPLAPQDRAATSMRMLVHDTQSSLEKFSERLDGLMTRVDDCRCQVINANKLLENERDKILAEMVDITSKSQNELKSYIGTPAQKHALELVNASQSATENSIRALEKRIDALQTLFQSHTSAIISIQDQQKAIQDQQSALLNAMLPLLPLLQNLPSQIDQMKTSFTDTISHATSNIENGMDGIKNSLHYLSSIRRTCSELPKADTTFTSEETSRKRTISETSNGQIHSCSETGCDLVSNRKPKRSRIDPPPASSLHATAVTISHEPAPPAQPLASANSLGHSYTSPSRAITHLKDPPVHPPGAVEPQLDMCASVRPTLPEDPGSGCMCSETNIGRDQKESMPKVLQTPKLSAQSLLQNGRMEGSENNLLPAHELWTNASSSLRSAQTISTLVLPPDPLELDATYASLKTTRLKGIHSGVPSPAQQIHPTIYPNAGAQHVRNATRSKVRNPPNTPRPRPPGSSNRQANHFLFSQLPSHDVVSKPSTTSTKSSPKSMSLRDRRAQLSLLGRTQTKRFIPLVPSSDDEE